MKSVENFQFYLSKAIENLKKAASLVKSKPEKKKPAKRGRKKIKK